MTLIKVKKYDHYNRALGKHISSRKQYEEECKRQGAIPKDKADEIAKKAREKQRKPYKVDKETERFIAEVRGTVKNGKVHLGSRAIDFMKKKGVKFDRTEYKGREGGFE